MASIIKRTKSKFWIACYTDRNGRQLKRSTKSTDRNQATGIAIELERVERQAKQGVLTTTQLRKVLNDVSEKVTGDTMIAPSTEDYLNEWLGAVETRNSPATYDRYSKTVRQFLVDLGGKAKQPVTSVTARDIDHFLTTRLKAGAAPKTAIVDLKILKTAFRRAELFGTILKNPVSPVRLPKDEFTEREIFTHDEVQKLLAATPSLEWQTLILLGYFVGARLGDCAQMKWDNVFPDKGVLVYEQKKTGKKVVVPMHYHITEHLNYLATFGTTGFLCPKLATKGSGGKHGLSESFIRIVKKAGIDPMIVPGKGIRQFTKRSFHSLRHSFNSALANAGVAEEVRMKLTGHASRPMNERYTHLQVETLKSAVGALPIFGAKADKAG